MNISSGNDELVQFRVRVPESMVRQIDAYVENAAFADRTAVVNFALFGFLSTSAQSAKADLQTLEQSNGVLLFSTLLLVSRIITDVERKHLYRIASSAADEGSPLAKFFIEEMGLHRSREARAAE